MITCFGMSLTAMTLVTSSNIYLIKSVASWCACLYICTIRFMKIISEIVDLTFLLNQCPRIAWLLEIKRMLGSLMLILPDISKSAKLTDNFIILALNHLYFQIWTSRCYPYRDICWLMEVTDWIPTHFWRKGSSGQISFRYLSQTDIIRDPYSGGQASRCDLAYWFSLVRELL